MEKLYYIPQWRMNARIAETVIEGDPITVEGTNYERVSRAPIGRSVVRRLRAMDESKRIVLYN
jgi:hypothetical protein|tara:strand:+ start:881 stop:1069 length:189 start_codon:yes stop_codon:yes gene_type:complete